MASPELLYVTQVAPYTHGPAGAHGVLDQSATAVAQLAELSGLGFRRVTDVRDLDGLGGGGSDVPRVVALFTIGETPWSADQQAALLGAVRAGRTSVLAIHSATDSCYGWDDYRLLVGARFDGHPWTATVTLDVLDGDHPAVTHLGPTWTWHDEVYRFRDLRPDATVVLAARPAELEGAGTTEAVPPFGFPLSWHFTEGEGRVFSTSLGHFPGAWETPDYLTHLAGAIGWLTED